MLLAGINCGQDTPSGGFPIRPVTVDTTPKWSPADSASIAYTHVAETIEEMIQFGEYSIWVLNIDTGVAEYVTEGVICDWSPDGTRIVFAVALDGLWIIDLATSEKSRLTCEDEGLCEHFGADFSPSAQQLVYVQDVDPGRGMWILDMQSMSKEWISVYNEPDWSPSETEILCAGLIIIGPDGTFLRRVPQDNLETAVNARWSPDGTKIALFGKDKEGKTGIWTIESDGSGLKFVTSGSLPSWSPNGKRIAFCGETPTGEAEVIWIVNVDGTERSQVTFCE